MALHNHNMISEAILVLDLADEQRVLEIGPGGEIMCPRCLNKQKNLKYYGVDISELMILESVKENQKLVNSDRPLLRWQMVKHLLFQRVF